MKALKFFMLFVFAFLLYNCGQEVPPIEPDKDEDVEIKDSVKLEKNYIFKLNGISSYDSIYIYENTYFRYSLTNQHDSIVPIEKVTFILNNQPVSSNNYGNDWIVLGYNNVSDVGSTLDVKVKITDSISELNFRFKVFQLNNHNLEIRQETTPDGFLKIFWNKLPEYKNLKIEKQVLTFKDRFSNEIVKELPSSITFYVDSTYVYGRRDFNLKTYYAVKDTTFPESFVSADYTVRYRKYTENDFLYEYIDGKRARFSWRKNDFKCIYSIAVAEGQNVIDFVLKHDETSIEFDREFPEDRKFNLYIIPINGDPANPLYEERVYWSYPGKYLFQGYPEYRTGYAVDVKNRALYFSLSDRVLSYNADKMQQISSYSIEGAHLNVSQSDSRVLVVDGTTFYIFKDATLKNPTIIEGYKSKLKRYSYASIGGEYLVSYNRYDNKADIYDSHTGKILFDIPIENNNTEVLLSPDGKYLVLYEPSHNGSISIHALTKTSAGQIYSAKDWWVEYCEFDPQDLNRLNLVMRYNRGYSVFDISKCEVIETVTTDYGRIDPFTGNRVCYEKDEEGSDYFVVYNKSKSKVLYKILGRGYNVELINNYLFTLVGLPWYYHYSNVKDYLAE